MNQKQTKSCSKEMASQNFSQNYFISDFDLICDLCQSSDIIETEQGYVCSNCGLVLEIPKMEYHYPYNGEIIQHAPLDFTLIGSLRERFQNQHSRMFHKLNKIHTSSSSKAPHQIKAKVEISRLLNGLGMSSNIKHIIFTEYKKIRKRLPPRTKFRNPEKLIPGVIYYHCKVNCNPIDETQLLKISKITKKDFRRLRLGLAALDLNYLSRNRKKYILNLILKVIEFYHLNMEFYYKAEQLLSTLWDKIKNTKDNIVAGVISSIIALCYYKNDITVNSICRILNIMMSTIQSQVKRNIIIPFEISGFRSLVKDSELFKRIIEELNILTNLPKSTEEESDDKQMENIDDTKMNSETIVDKTYELVYLKCENIVFTLKGKKRKDIHIFAIKNNHGTELIIFTLSMEFLDNYSITQHKKNTQLEIYRLYFGKGPP